MNVRIKFWYQARTLLETTRDYYGLLEITMDYYAIACVCVYL